MTLYHGTNCKFENFDMSHAGTRTEGAACPDEFISLCKLGFFFLDNTEGHMSMYADGYIAEIEADCDPSEGEAYICHMDDMIRWLELASAEEIIEELSEEYKMIQMDNGSEYEYIIFNPEIIKSITWRAVPALPRVA